eukprot:scaffold4902_cov99-Amphora_coffeaeformis.AAC.1
MSPVSDISHVSFKQRCGNIRSQIRSQFATEVRTSRRKYILRAAILLWDEEYKNYLHQQNYEVDCSIS